MIDFLNFLFIVKVICLIIEKSELHANIKKKHNEFIALTLRKKPARAFWCIYFQKLI